MIWKMLVGWIVGTAVVGAVWARVGWVLHRDKEQASGQAEKEK